MTQDNATQDKSGPSTEPANDPRTRAGSYTENSEVAENHGALPSTVVNADLPKSQAESEAEGNPQKKWLDRWGPWKRWRQYRLSKRFRSDYYDHWSTRDREENDRGRLPDGEKLEMPAIWVAELYTPSTVQGLITGIDALGWQYSKTRNDSLTKWMNDVREGRKAGWVNLGLVSCPNDPLFMRERIAPLPSGVKAALPTLMSITPSLTALVIVFLLNDDTASSLQEPLRADYQTRTEKDALFRRWHLVRHILTNGSVRLGYQIYNPDLIRRETVKSRLRHLEDGCVQWVQDHLPGSFSSQPQERAPTATLLVTEKVMPLTAESRQIRAFDGLAINRDYDAWKSNEWPGARLVLPHGWEDEGSRLVFACRRHDAFPDEPMYPDSLSNWTIAQRAGDHIQGLLSRWALTCLLDTYHKALSALRDQTARDGQYKPLDDLKSFVR